MSGLTVIQSDEMKAPPGKLRLVKIRFVNDDTDEVSGRFLVGDFDKREPALDRWRSLKQLQQRDPGRLGYTFFVFNERGQEVGILGTRIPESERKAPQGHFRLVCFDTVYCPDGEPSCWLQDDISNKADAIKAAKSADYGPHTLMAVFDEHGVSLFA